jgi:hypothetical protein
MKRRRCSDYSKKRAPVSNDHEETDDAKEIMFPTMASRVARKKNRKVKSLNLQCENSAMGRRSTLGREKKVARGLGFGFHRESSVSRGLASSNRTGAREEEIQFDLPKRPRTKRQRQRDGDSISKAQPCLQRHRFVPYYESKKIVDDLSKESKFRRQER